MTDSLQPYRSAPLVARYVCVACHRSLSTIAGDCPRCGVERLALSRPDVREEVRTFAEDRLRERYRTEELVLFSGSFGVGMVVATVASALAGGLEPRLWFYGGAFLAVPIRWLAVRLAPRFYPQSAIVAYAARRVRLKQQLGFDVDMRLTDQSSMGQPHDERYETPSDETLAKNATAPDPELDDLNDLLRSIGAKLDG